MAGHDDRPLGAADHLRHALDLAWMSLNGGPIAREINTFWVLELCLVSGYIFGNIDQHGARPACARDVEGLFHHCRQVSYVSDQITVLGDWHGDAGDVYLLKCISTQEVGCDLSRDCHNGRGIHISCGDAGDQIRCAGARRGEADSDLAGDTRVAIGGMGGGLFVAYQDVT